MSDPQYPRDESVQTAKDWWEQWSERFQQEFGEGDAEVAIAFGPGASDGDDLELIGDVDGIRAIELGCGGGQFGIALSKAGATVTGVDISSEQLAHARTLAADHGEAIDFIEASVTDMPMIEEGTYDLAFSAFAFQWVKDLSACFSEAHRVLKPGGRFVFSVDHPLYRCLDPETGDLTTSYFDDTPRRNYSEKLDAEMVIYRRTVSDIVTAVLDAGFSIDALREPGHADPEKYESAYGSFQPDRMARIPPTLVIAARAQ